MKSRQQYQRENGAPSPIGVERPPRVTGEADEPNAILFVRLLHAGGLEVFEGGLFRAVLDLEDPLLSDQPLRPVASGGFRRPRVVSVQ